VELFVPARLCSLMLKPLRSLKKLAVLPGIYSPTGHRIQDVPSLVNAPGCKLDVAPGRPAVFASYVFARRLGCILSLKTGVCKMRLELWR